MASLCSQYIPSRPKKQKGVALITVLFIFAIATIIASEIVSRTYFSIRSTASQLIHAQAYQYALGGEALAKQILHKDFQTDQSARISSPNDHLNENWARLDKVYEFDQGKLEIHIVDLQSLFNINNIVNNQGELNERYLDQFQKILNFTEIDKNLANNLADWLDKDIIPLGINTEDQGYLGMERPYRSANRPMAHLSELKLIQGVDASKFAKLEGLVTVLPKFTAVNVNTVDAELLNLLMDGQQPDGAKKILAGRGEAGYKSVSAFLENLNNKGISLQEADLTVRSEFFMVRVKSTFAKRVVWLTSILHRDLKDGTINLLSRDKSSHFKIPAGNKVAL